MELNRYIDYTIVQPDTTITDIEKLCREAKQNNFAAVCVPPLFIKKCKELLHGSAVKTATVIGYPFGYAAIEAKLAETLLALVDGADELDMVVNIMAIKNSDWQYIANELNHILPIVKERGKVAKMIIEAGLLTNDEILKCCKLYAAAGIDYLQTSTEYAKQGANEEMVTLIKQNLPAHVQVKASGGITSKEQAERLVAAGAGRIGCTQLLV